VLILGIHHGVVLLLLAVVVVLRGVMLPMDCSVLLAGDMTIVFRMTGVALCSSSSLSLSSALVRKISGVAQEVVVVVVVDKEAEYIISIKGEDGVEQEDDEAEAEDAT
jgi:hypothetical protein